MENFTDKVITRKRYYLLGVLLFLYIFDSFFDICVVDGRSMVPTYFPHEIVLISKINITEGNIVYAIDNEGYGVIKRIKWMKKGRAFLIGDNEKESVDSRTLGTVRTDQIKGYVVFGMYYK